jgi:hypothetical protein
LRLNDFAVGPFVLDFTNSAFEEKPGGGSTPMRFVASITVFPSMPCTLLRTSVTAPRGTATTTALPEAIDALGSKESHRVYRMMGMEVNLAPDGSFGLSEDVIGFSKLRV